LIRFLSGKILFIFGIHLSGQIDPSRIPPEMGTIQNNSASVLVLWQNILQ